MKHRLPLLVLPALAAALLYAPSALAASPSNPAVDYVTSESILAPADDGNFLLAVPVTRIEFTLAVVDRYYGEADTQNCFRNIAPSLPVRFTRLFRDVANTDVSAPRLCVAMMAGLVKENRNGDFRPYAPITVAEASKILAQANGFTYPSKTETTRPWYWSSMESLRQRGAITVSSKADSIVTRSDAATMFYALRSAERFPETRIIGRSNTTLEAALTCTNTACADDRPIARRTVLQRVSRRTLVRKTEQARMHLRPLTTPEAAPKPTVSQPQP